MIILVEEEITETKQKQEAYLDVENLKTQFFTNRGIVKALDNVSFHINRGEIYGLVGESGCGKSVTATSVIDLIPDPPGRIINGKIILNGFNILGDLDKLAKIKIISETNVKIKRRKRLIKRHNFVMSRIRGDKVAMIFQEPSLALNPVIRIGDQIMENILLHKRIDIANSIIRREGATRKDYEPFVDRILSLSDKVQISREIKNWCDMYAVSDVEDIVKNLFSTYKDREIIIRDLEKVVSEERSGTDIHRIARARDYYRYEQKLFDLTLKEIEAEYTNNQNALQDVRNKMANLKRENPGVTSFKWSIKFMGKRVDAPFKKAARRRTLELLTLVNIAEPARVIDSYPHELSGGMQQRALIAMALASDPSLLIADEPTTALDVTTQAQILDLIRDLNNLTQASVLFITHDLAVIAEMCNRVGVMYAGNIVEEASVTDIFENPKHPYTTGLLQSIPRVDKAGIRMMKLETIPGNVPNLITPPTGCRFHPRCKFKMDICETSKPKLVDLGGNHKVACFLYSTEGEVQ